MAGTVEAQANAYERNVKAFIRRTLLDFGRRFRGRMMTERIGGGPQSALQVKTGKLKRDFRYKLVETPYGYKIEAEIGRTAPYANDHEDLGRLEFVNTFEQEAETALSSIESGLKFFERNPFGGPVGGGGAGELASSAAGGSERAALLSQFKAHYQQKREQARIRRRNSWRSIARGG